MRTVTFSDAETARFVNDHFVSAWKNRDPGFHNCEFQQEQHILASSPKAFTTRNIITYVLTPDLDVIHYMTGYYHPTPFREEMTFAINLARICFDAGFRITPIGLERFAAAHKAHAAMHERSATSLDQVEEVQVASRSVPSSGGPAGGPTLVSGIPGAKGIAMAVPVVTAPQPASAAAARAPQMQTVLTHGMMSWDMREFHRYLGTVHEHLNGAPRSITEIERDTRVGNNFAEETPETARRSWEEIDRKRKRAEAEREIP